MNMTIRLLALSVLATSVFGVRLGAAYSQTPPASADHDHHHHHDHGDGEQPVERPKILLDKSLRIVEYQLGRLDNARLLLAETSTDDPKYLPVFRAILLRSGMSRQNREEALSGMTAINKSDVAAELLNALASLTAEDRDQQRVGRQLSELLLERPQQDLQQMHADLQRAAENGAGVLQATGFAGLMVSGNTDEAWQLAQPSPETRIAWLSAVPLLPDVGQRNLLRTQLVSLLAPEQPTAVRLQAIRSVTSLSAEQRDSFQRLAGLVRDSDYRTAAVRSLLKIEASQRDPEVAHGLVDFLVTFAERTPAADRTSDEFLDAMQLADELLQTIPAEDARPIRERLRAAVVRVVRLHTIEEEMRYDKTWFAVEAGRPVQVVLENDDLMPHNLVITRTGKLKEVALAGAELGTRPGRDGMMYVPESPDVMFAMNLVNAGQRGVLTFTAPTEPGEYPYVCTFPRHWMRMYGVMVVVPDLDAWQQSPVEPKDPLGNTRAFVKSWQLTDFNTAALGQAVKGRSSDIGARLFKEATCLGCHTVRSEGGKVGPDLTDVMKRWKGDRAGILREMLEPAYRIDPKYAVKIVVDNDGLTTSGIVTAEDNKSISILVNPEVPEPKIIQKSDIDEIVPSTTSMMPKALLDKFTENEIMELLAYLTGAE